MTIKTRLIFNVLVITAIVALMLTVGLFSVQFLREKLVYLTEQSTPFQTLTLELQKELQGCIAALLRVDTSADINEYRVLRAEAEKKLATVDTLQQMLAKQHNSLPDISAELGKLAQQLFIATEKRAESSSTALAANSNVSQRMHISSERLKELDKSIRLLQSTHAAAFTKALDNTGKHAVRLRDIEELRDLLKDLLYFVKSLQTSDRTASMLVSKGRMNTLFVKISANAYINKNNALMGQFKKIMSKLSGQFGRLATAVKENDRQAEKQAGAAMSEITADIGSVFLQLEQERMLAMDLLEVESRRQRESFSQSGRANNVLVANSELVASGLRLAADINRLLAVESTGELEQLDKAIRTRLGQLGKQIDTIEKALIELKATDELKLLEAASAALSATAAEVVSSDGILSRLGMKLQAMKHAELVTGRLNELVKEQTAKGNKMVSAAREEQNKAVVDVKNMLAKSLYRIAVIGVLAVVIGIFFGFWIYRSVLLPLRAVLGAVRAQQLNGQAKALVAEEIANGNLDIDVEISKAIKIDLKKSENDEMGMVLKAVEEMGEAQITLDKALSDMTVSLRAGRDAEASRDRLKNGLHELNMILRGEHKLADLLEYSLAFIAAFLDAGVGIIYLHEKENDLLLPFVTYAISLAERPDAGRLKSGEGLAGQVLIDHKTVHLKDIPPGYLPVSSALGEADPVEIVIMPVIHNGNLAGVMELGSFRKFGNDDLEFLRQGLEGIAIAINTCRSRGFAA